jgi:hypothetical protein
MAMEWPHDPDGDAGSEGMRKFGLAVVAKKVDEEDDFPLDVGTFVEEHGADPVRINHERVVALEEIFDYVDEDTFSDKVAFNRGVGNAFREGGFWEYAPGT